MTETKKYGICWSLWIPVTLAFLLVIAAWFTIIKIARENPTEIVPLDSTTENSDH